MKNYIVTVILIAGDDKSITVRLTDGSKGGRGDLNPQPAAPQSAKWRDLTS